MAILDELVTQIENPDLRARIAAEVEKLAKQKKFGLVFEEHLPECTPLWDIPVKAGRKAALKTGHVNDFYTVLKIEDGQKRHGKVPCGGACLRGGIRRAHLPLSQAHRHGLQRAGQRPVAHAHRG